MNGDETKERIARFQSFFMNNYPRVKAFAWKLLKSEEDAEDIPRISLPNYGRNRNCGKVGTNGILTCMP